MVAPISSQFLRCARDQRRPGSYPWIDLTRHRQSAAKQSAKGHIDGTTSLGGPADGTGASNGTIFKYSAASGLQTLASFDNTNTASPDSLVTDGAGNYYGLTWNTL